jgi:hypothetical protein
MTEIVSSLPLVIAGPIVRHVSQNTFTLWLVTTYPIRPELHFFEDAISDTSKSFDSQKIEHHAFQVGEFCYINTVIINQDSLFSEQQVIHYDVFLTSTDNDKQPDTTPNWLSEALPALCYSTQGKQKPRFSVKYQRHLRKVIHGSCRKAHFSGKDALVQMDELIGSSIGHDQLARPDILLFTGDQVYIDDVAGPMICAIKQVIQMLGLYHESFEGSTIEDSEALFADDKYYYLRESLLPITEANEGLSDSFFKGKRKPIFTSVNASNHLIALNEMVALYLLSWSSRLWPHIHMDSASIAPNFTEKYQTELVAIENFKLGLPAIERAFAHVPIYMIFDDHDVTDDWNLTRAWEDHVYGNPFSKRIVGNALVAYFLCQGIGNPKVTWQAISEKADETFNHGIIKQQDELIDALLAHDHWHYRLDTFPPIQVLDTRTQRWRSESNKNKPSGLMDWEALCELQQDVIGQESVIMVSAAPVYGVKFIEAIQRIFITFGGALVVDAENWMAHRGTASVMLNIFRHIKTPPQFIILSGDVHYSFVYDVSLKFRRNSPKITQFTCSGIHNEFPEKLITWFERLNRWFYGHRSPLNWLTKRRNMTIKEREADNTHKDIVCATALGLLELDEQGHEQACKLILSDGKIVTFTK